MRMMIFFLLLFVVSCSMSSESFRQHSWYNIHGMKAEWYPAANFLFETIHWETYDKNIR